MRSITLHHEHQGRLIPRLRGGEAAEATLESVSESVARLTQAVGEMREGAVDRETVQRIAQEVMEESAQRRGYTPEAVHLNADGNPRDAELELLGSTPARRLQSLLELPARDTAAILGRETGDIEEFRTRADNLVILGTILGAQGRISDVRETNYYRTQFAPAMRAAFDTSTAGEGAEYVPTVLSSQLIERVNLALRVLAFIPEVGMPSSPFEIPAYALQRVRGGRHVEQTADSGQVKIKKVTPGTRKVVLTAAKFATEVLTSKEAEEDQIIAVLPHLREELVDFTAADLEDTAINGDAQGTHRDSDSDGADDPRKNWDGIRQLANANGAERDHGGGDLDVAGLRANRKAMGKYGIDPGNLVHILGMSAYIDLLGDEKVQTVDKYGANATVLTGELGRADGVPLIVSEYVRGDLNATGVHDGVTETKTIAATIHRRALLRGTRREMSVEFLRELYSESDQDAVKVSTRQALAERYEGEPAVVVSYNVDAT